MIKKQIISSLTGIGIGLTAHRPGVSKCFSEVDLNIVSLTLDY